MEETKIDTLHTVRIQQGALVGVTCPHSNCRSVSYFNTKKDGFGHKPCEKRNGNIDCPGYILEDIATENAALYNASIHVA